VHKPLNVLVIDIGGTKLTMGMYSGDQLATRKTLCTDRVRGRDWVLEQIAEVAGEWKGCYDFHLCGVSFGGPVNYYIQRIYQSTHASGWHDFDLVGWLYEKFRVSAVIDNDANLGALGEYTFGAGRGFDPFVYLTLSTGIGGGIIIDGKVLHGADSFAGEIGHFPVIPDGPQCLCGSNGCLERMCSGLWLEQDQGKSTFELFADPGFVSEFVVTFAQGLKTVLMILNPARIAIGGGISKVGDALFIPLRQELARQIPAWSRSRIDLVPAAYPDDCTLLGALALTRNVKFTLPANAEN
jgi:glucokinase